MTADTQAQGDLPELPVRALRAAPIDNERWPFPMVDYFTADQMREYARSCVSAALQGRAQEGEPSDERAAFEAWIAKDCGDLRTFGSGRNIHYSNSAVNNAWTGWNRRAALAQAQKERT